MVGDASEKHVRRYLESLDWYVEDWGRSNFSGQLNTVLNTFRDSFSRPCLIGKNPDWLVYRPGSPRPAGLYGVGKVIVSPNLPSDVYGVDAKCMTGGCHINQMALDAYVAYEDAFRLPVVIVFHDLTECSMEERQAFFAGKDTGDAGTLRPVSAGKALRYSTPVSTPSGGSGLPYYQINPDALEKDMSRFFGSKRRK